MAQVLKYGPWICYQADLKFSGGASLVQIRMYALVQISYVVVSPNIKIGISPNFW